MQIQSAITQLPLPSKGSPRIDSLYINTLIVPQLSKMFQAQQEANRQKWIDQTTPKSIWDPWMNRMARDRYRQKYERLWETELAGRLIGGGLGAGFGAILGATIGGIVGFYAGGVGAAPGAAAGAKIGAGIGGSIGVATSDYTTFHATMDYFDRAFIELFRNPVKGIMNSMNAMGQSLDMATGSTFIKASIISAITGRDYWNEIANRYGWGSKGRQSMYFSEIREELSIDAGGLGNFTIDMLGEMVTDPGTWARWGTKLSSKAATEVTTKAIAQETTSEIGKTISKHVNDIDKGIEALNKGTEVPKQFSGKSIKQLEIYKKAINHRISSSVLDKDPSKLLNTLNDIAGDKKFKIEEIDNFINQVFSKSIKSTSVKLYDLFKTQQNVRDIVAKSIKKTTGTGIMKEVYKGFKYFDSKVLGGKISESLNLRTLYSKKQLANMVKKYNLDYPDEAMLKKTKEELYTDFILKKQLAKNSPLYQEMLKEHEGNLEKFVRTFNTGKYDEAVKLYKDIKMTESLLVQEVSGKQLGILRKAVRNLEKIQNKMYLNELAGNKLAEVTGEDLYLINKELTKIYNVIHTAKEDKYLQLYLQSLYDNDIFVWVEQNITNEIKNNLRETILGNLPEIESLKPFDISSSQILGPLSLYRLLDRSSFVEGDLGYGYYQSYLSKHLNNKIIPETKNIYTSLKNQLGSKGLKLFDDPFFEHLEEEAIKELKIEYLDESFTIEYNDFYEALRDSWQRGNDQVREFSQSLIDTTEEILEVLSNEEDKDLFLATTEISLGKIAGSFALNTAEHVKRSEHVNAIYRTILQSLNNKVDPNVEGVLIDTLKQARKHLSNKGEFFDLLSTNDLKAILHNAKSDLENTTLKYKQYSSYKNKTKMVEQLEELLKIREQSGDPEALKNFGKNSLFKALKRYIYTRNTNTLEEIESRAVEIINGAKGVLFGQTNSNMEMTYLLNTLASSRGSIDEPARQLLISFIKDFNVATKEVRPGQLEYNLKKLLEKVIIEQSNVNVISAQELLDGVYGKLQGHFRDPLETLNELIDKQIKSIPNDKESMEKISELVDYKLKIQKMSADIKRQRGNLKTYLKDKEDIFKSRYALETGKIISEATIDDANMAMLLELEHAFLGAKRSFRNAIENPEKDSNYEKLAELLNRFTKQQVPEEKIPKEIYRLFKTTTPLLPRDLQTTSLMVKRLSEFLETITTKVDNKTKFINKNLLAAHADSLGEDMDTILTLLYKELEVRKLLSESGIVNAKAFHLEFKNGKIQYVLDNKDNASLLKVLEENPHINIKDIEEVQESFIDPTKKNDDLRDKINKLLGIEKANAQEITNKVSIDESPLFNYLDDQNLRATLQSFVTNKQNRDPGTVLNVSKSYAAHYPKGGLTYKDTLQFVTDVETSDLHFGQTVQISIRIGNENYEFFLDPDSMDLEISDEASKLHGFSIDKLRDLKKDPKQKHKVLPIGKIKEEIHKIKEQSLKLHGKNAGQIVLTGANVEYDFKSLANTFTEGDLKSMLVSYFGDKYANMSDKEIFEYMTIGDIMEVLSDEDKELLDVIILDTAPIAASSKIVLERNNVYVNQIVKGHSNLNEAIRLGAIGYREVYKDGRIDLPYGDFDDKLVPYVEKNMDTGVELMHNADIDVLFDGEVRNVHDATVDTLITKKIIDKILENEDLANLSIENFQDYEVVSGKDYLAKQFFDFDGVKGEELKNMFRTLHQLSFEDDDLNLEGFFSEGFYETSFKEALYELRQTLASYTDKQTGELVFRDLSFKDIIRLDDDLERLYDIIERAKAEGAIKLVEGSVLVGESPKGFVKGLTTILDVEDQVDELYSRTQNYIGEYTKRVTNIFPDFRQLQLNKQVSGMQSLKATTDSESFKLLDFLFSEEGRDPNKDLDLSKYPEFERLYNIVHNKTEGLINPSTTKGFQLISNKLRELKEAKELMNNVLDIFDKDFGTVFDEQNNALDIFYKITQDLNKKIEEKVDLTDNELDILIDEYVKEFKYIKGSKRLLEPLKEGEERRSSADDYRKRNEVRDSDLGKKGFTKIRELIKAEFRSRQIDLKPIKVEANSRDIDELHYLFNDYFLPVFKDMAGGEFDRIVPSLKTSEEDIREGVKVILSEESEKVMEGTYGDSREVTHIFNPTTKYAEDLVKSFTDDARNPLRGFTQANKDLKAMGFIRGTTLRKQYGMAPTDFISYGESVIPVIPRKGSKAVGPLADSSKAKGLMYEIVGDLYGEADPNFFMPKEILFDDSKAGRILAEYAEVRGFENSAHFLTVGQGSWVQERKMYYNMVEETIDEASEKYQALHRVRTQNERLDTDIFISDEAIRASTRINQLTLEDMPQFPNEEALTEFKRRMKILIYKAQEVEPGKYKHQLDTFDRLFEGVDESLTNIARKGIYGDNLKFNEYVLEIISNNFSDDPKFKNLLELLKEHPEKRHPYLVETLFNGDPEIRKMFKNALEYNLDYNTQLVQDMINSPEIYRDLVPDFDDFLKEIVDEKDPYIRSLLIEEEVKDNKYFKAYLSLNTGMSHQKYFYRKMFEESGSGTITENILYSFENQDGTYNLEGLQNYFNNSKHNKLIVHVHKNGKEVLRKVDVNDTKLLGEVLSNRNQYRLTIMDNNTFLKTARKMEPVILPKWLEKIHSNFIAPTKILSLFNPSYLINRFITTPIKNFIASGSIKDTASSYAVASKQFHTFNEMFSRVAGNWEMWETHRNLNTIKNIWINELENNWDKYMEGPLDKELIEELKFVQDFMKLEGSSWEFHEFDKNMELHKKKVEFYDKLHQKVKDGIKLTEDEEKHWYVIKDEPDFKFSTIEEEKKYLEAVVYSGHSTHLERQRYFHLKEGQNNNDVLKTIYNTYRLIGVKQSLSLISSLESIGRLAMYNNDIMNGLTKSEISQRLIDIHFDYSNKSIAERYAELIVPFVGYPIKTAMLFDELMETHAGMKFITDFTKYSWGKKEFEDSDFLMNRKLRGDIPLNKNLGITIGNPFYQAMKVIGDPLGSFQDKLSPFIKPLVDLASGSDRVRWQGIPGANQINNIYNRTQPEYQTHPVRTILPSMTKTYYSNNYNLYMKRQYSKYSYKNYYTQAGYSRTQMRMQPTTLKNLPFRVNDIMYMFRQNR